MAQIDENKAELLKDKIERLLSLTDLTWEALQEGTKISPATIRRIQDKKTNLSKSNQKKIKAFFGSPQMNLFSDSDSDFISTNRNASYLRFKEDGKLNPEYLKSENEFTSAAEFVKYQILNNEIFEKPLKKRQMLDILKSSPAYKSKFTEDSMSKEIERLHNKEKILATLDPKKNKSYFLYYRLKKQD